MKNGYAACLGMLFLMATAFAAGDLQQVHPKGTAEMLDQLDLNAVETIEIVKLDWFKHVINESDPTLTRRVYAEGPIKLKEGKREQAAALLKLIKNAPPHKAARIDEDAPPSDSVLIVRKKDGESFEIWYNSHLSAPFAGRYSLDLKEALWALSHIETKITIVHVKDGKVKRTIPATAIAPHRGGVYSAALTTELHFTQEKGLTLYLRLMAKDDFKKSMKDRTVEMEDEQPAHYDESTIYKSPDGDTYVVPVRQ